MVGLAIDELRKFVAPEFVFGNGARRLAGQYARNLGARRVLVVTDPGVREVGWTAEVLASLEEVGLECSVFDDVSPNPRDSQVMDGAERYLAEGCNAIVAVGGGSPMDCAKGIGIVATSGGHIHDYEGVDRIPAPTPVLVFVPTTAGSSADVSQFAIISNQAERYKLAIISKAVVPDIALVDPETTLSMDRALSAATGMDALCHAFEALASNAASPVTDVHALDAIRRVVRHLPGVLERSDDLLARSEMMLGSLQAGLAFSNASLGAVHAMAHALGGLLDLAHGDCNALLLPVVVGYNFDHATEAYRLAAEAMGLPVSGRSDDEVREALVEALASLRALGAMDVSLSQRGVKREELSRLADRAMQDACMVTNPRIPTSEEIEALYAETS